MNKRMKMFISSMVSIWLIILLFWAFMLKPPPESDLEVHFFYREECQTFKYSEAFLAELKMSYTEIDIQPHLLNGENPRDEQLFEIYTLKYGVPPRIPLLVLFDKTAGKQYVYQGKEDITEAPFLISQKLGLPQPNKFVFPETYQTKEICDFCHKSRGISPPETAHCDTCCHNSTGVLRDIVF